MPLAHAATVNRVRHSVRVFSGTPMICVTPAGSPEVASICRPDPERPVTEVALAVVVHGPNPPSKPGLTSRLSDTTTGMLTVCGPLPSV